MFAMSFGYTTTWYLFATAYAVALVLASRFVRV
jgi:hypothetical protein